jgi:Domain of unknown function (DUF4145)
MGEDEVSVLCGHCNRNVTASVRATYRWVYDEEFGAFTEWRILQCKSCDRPLLYEAGSEDEPILVRPALHRFPGLPEKWDFVPKMLYPETKVRPAELPGAVTDAYMDVLRVRLVSPNACAAMIRWTLEEVCNDKNVEGKDLNTKLEQLATDGRMPPTLAQMARQLRQLGNKGAHADPDDRIAEADIPIMMDLLEAILEYLYIAPAKVQRVEARLNKSLAKQSRRTDGGNLPPT